MNLHLVKFIPEINTTDEQIRENVTENLKRTLPRVRRKPAVFIGGGASVRDNVAAIAALKSKAAIFAMNGTHDWLIENGIVPDFHIMMDAREDNLVFLQNPHEDVEYLLCSTCHPSLFEALSGHDVRMWHQTSVEGIQDLIRSAEPKSTIHVGMSTVGLSAPLVAYTMGYSDFYFFGYDSSQEEDAHHAYAQPLNDGCQVHEVVHRGKAFRASGMMASQAQKFVQMLPMWERLGVKITVVGSGLLPYMLANRGKTGDQDIDEREKYQRMWAVNSYRKVSPGEQLAPVFISNMRPDCGDKIVDFGCGPGRATKFFETAGFKVLGVDFAANSLDDDVNIPFCLANLWSLPDPVKGDWGYCCDVMEHIPPDRVEDVLTNISRSVTKGAFFNISFKPDKMGVLIGETLHLTVESQAWWHDQLSNHFACVQHLDNGVFICWKDRNDS